MHSDFEKRLTALFAGLLPSKLKEEIALPHGEIREAYVPRLLAVFSYEDMQEELGRFVCFAMDRWIGPDWSSLVGGPLGAAEHLVREVLEASVGMESALAACAYQNAGGVRWILDVLLEGLHQRALAQYVDSRVLPLVQGLSADDSLALAEAYLDEFGGLGSELSSPGLIVTSWREVLLHHARLVLIGR